MLQLVFRWEKDSVAAMNIETSCRGAFVAALLSREMALATEPESEMA